MWAPLPDSKLSSPLFPPLAVRKATIPSSYSLPEGEKPGPSRSARWPTEGSCDL